MGKLKKVGGKSFPRRKTSIFRIFCNFPGPSIGFFLTEKTYSNRGRKIKKGNFRQTKQSEFIQIVSKTI